VRLEGSLDAFSLPDIFSLLSMTKKTGGLHLRRAGAHGVVWLSDGLLTGGASDLTRQSLARRIAGTGLVPDDALAAAVGQVGHDEDLGVARVLRDALSIDEGDLHSVVSEHIVDSVFDLMRWSEGEFEFVVDESNIDDVGVTRDVDDVVAESRRRLEIWVGIDAKVAAPATVLSITLDPDGDPTLSRDEWALLALIDGRRSVGELVSMCGRGQYAVVVALAELVSRGLLKTNDTEGVLALVRRQELLSSLETGAPVRPMRTDPPTSPAAPVDPFPASTPVAPAPREEEPAKASFAATGPTLVSSTEQSAELDSSDPSDSADDGQMAEVSSINRLSAEVAPVTPQRPEFLPDRSPEHPEPLAAVAGGGSVAGAMPMTAAAAAIERDPSVNKSLLLRLIAGVRGL
jgi:hypothetical protein